MTLFERGIRRLCSLLTIFVIGCGGASAFGQDDELIIDDRPVAPIPKWPPG